MHTELEPLLYVKNKTLELFLKRAASNQLITDCVRTISTITTRDGLTQLYCFHTKKLWYIL